MNCGGLWGTGADKKVQIGKSEEDQSRSYSLFTYIHLNLFTSFFFFFNTPLIHPLSVMWSNWIDCLRDAVKARQWQPIRARRYCLPSAELVKRSGPSPPANEINIELMLIIFHYDRAGLWELCAELRECRRQGKEVLQYLKFGVHLDVVCTPFWNGFYCWNDAMWRTKITQNHTGRAGGAQLPRLFTRHHSRHSDW